MITNKNKGGNNGTKKFKNIIRESRERGRVARITLPIKWLDSMKIIPEDRTVIVNFDSKTKERVLKKL